MSSYSRPQSPLYHKEKDTYFYPLTTIDQVIMEDETRLNKINFLSVNKDGAAEGKANPVNADTLNYIPAEEYATKDFVEDNAVSKSQVINNFTTTEEGFVADARAVEMLNKKLESPNEYYEYDWSNCMVRISRYGKIRFVNIYIDTKVEAASTLGTLLEIDCPIHNVKIAEWVPQADNSAYKSRVVEIKTNGMVSIDGDVWRGGFSIMYIVP